MPHKPTRGGPRLRPASTLVAGGKFRSQTRQPACNGENFCFSNPYPSYFNNVFVAGFVPRQGHHKPSLSRYHTRKYDIFRLLRVRDRIRALPCARRGPRRVTQLTPHGDLGSRDPPQLASPIPRYCRSCERRGRRRPRRDPAPWSPRRRCARPAATDCLTEDAMPMTSSRRGERLNAWRRSIAGTSSPHRARRTTGRKASASRSRLPTACGRPRRAGAGVRDFSPRIPGSSRHISPARLRCCASPARPLPRYRPPRRISARRSGRTHLRVNRRRSPRA